MFVIYCTTKNYYGNLTKVANRRENNSDAVKIAKCLLNFCYGINLVHKFLVKLQAVVYSYCKGSFVNISELSS